MIARNAFNASRQRANELLISRGYEPVIPVESSYLSDYTQLHLIGMRGNFEALCVKLRMATGSVTVAYVEHLCRYEICRFRALLSIDPGNIFIRCEMWVASPNGSIHCFEVLPTEIREVAAYAR